MNIIVLLIILLLVLGGGGLYIGDARGGLSGIGILILIVVLLYVAGYLR